MTIRSLQIFEKVAQCGKMSTAAQELYITQSSVSQAIAEIERTYNTRLFERLSKRLHLTYTGQELLVYARKMLALQETMEEFLKQSAESKQLRVGATITVGTCVMNEVVNAITKEIPAIDIEVFVANTHILEEKLLCNELDIALVEGRISNPDLITKVAMDDWLRLACGKGHPFWGREEIALAELANMDLVLREKGSGTRAQLEDTLASNKIPYKVKWECYSAEAIKNAVKEQRGVTVISERLIRDEVEKGILWSCGITNMDLKRSFDLVYHKDKFISETLQRMMDIIYNGEIR